MNDDMKFFWEGLSLSPIERDYVIGHLAGLADGGNKEIAEALEEAMTKAREWSKEESESGGAPVDIGPDI